MLMSMSLITRLVFLNHIIMPQHDKANGTVDMSSQRLSRSEKSVSIPFELKLMTMSQVSGIQTVKSLTRLRGCQGRFESSFVAMSFLRFGMQRLIYDKHKQRFSHRFTYIKIFIAISVCF